MAALAKAEILAVSGLVAEFATEAGIVRAVDGVDFVLHRDETLAIVGESGCGKSVSCLSLLRLIEAPGRVAAGHALLRRKDASCIDLLAAPEATLRHVRGDDIAMIFQEPMTSLNPLYPVGDQIAEAVQQHRGLSRKEAWSEAVAMLRRVRIADAELRAGDYPHQMSGGMRQRVMIAMALSCRPTVLIADEPTTALDVTIQAQILDLMRMLKRQSSTGMGILFVTHNMGVVAEIADRVMVMYAGLAVESGPVREVFRRPLHPYTRGLFTSMARARGLRGARRQPLNAIPGNVPDPLRRPPGCPFAPRCSHAEDACRATVPVLEQVSAQRQSRCRRWREL
jgi:oligopeptide/dipeptide ABC transporter ATP-binding protein